MRQEESLFSQDPSWSRIERKPIAPEDPVDVEEKAPRIRAACFEHTPRYLYRRAFSEVTLLDSFGELPHQFKNGECYNFITGGDIDELTYLKVILRSQTLDHCLLSTWCMSAEDAFQIIEWLDSHSIERMDIYVGEIFKGSYKLVWRQLHDWYLEHPERGRICVFRNHSKIIAGSGPSFAFGLQSSANVDTNPRTENACLQIGQDLYKFYKDFFDGIVTFEKEDRDREKTRLGQ